jgi:hypothetical protein
MSPELQRAWDAAASAFREFVLALRSGERIATGVPASGGARCQLDPAEWVRAGLFFDVQNGDLIEQRDGRWTLRWSTLALSAAPRAAKKPRQQQQRRGPSHNWQGVWLYAKTLRANDQWDWVHVPRDKKQPLPAVHKLVEDKIKDWFASRGGVPDISDIRRNIVVPLYAGRQTWGKRRR